MLVHVLSFEGPDAYSRVGGLATRVEGLVQTLAAQYETHLWFIGDPNRPGHESFAPRPGPGLHLHRWCQWISRHHGGGVYQDEEGKVADFTQSLAPWLVPKLVESLSHHKRAVILAEEWQTVGALLQIDRLLRRAGVRHRVRLLWNANNIYGFDNIPWAKLQQAATITTVSRYMKQWLRDHHSVLALVVPNGLAPGAYTDVPTDQLREFRRRTQARMVLAKVARFDPDKRWHTAVDAVHELKKQGVRPLLVARGGNEHYGASVVEHAKQRGLNLLVRELLPGAHGVLDGVTDVAGADIVLFESHLDHEAKALLFKSASSVWANSAHEPFGLVGLETMAVGGVACTGCTGEDYAISGSNALVTQSGDPRELIQKMTQLRAKPSSERALRREAQRTARRYAWARILEQRLKPYLETQA